MWCADGRVWSGRPLRLFVRAWPAQHLKVAVFGLFGWLVLTLLCVRRLHEIGGQVGKKAYMMAAARFFNLGLRRVCEFRGYSSRPRLRQVNRFRAPFAVRRARSAAF